MMIMDAVAHSLITGEHKLLSPLSPHQSVHVISSVMLHCARLNISPLQHNWQKAVGSINGWPVDRQQHLLHQIFKLHYSFYAVKRRPFPTPAQEHNGIPLHKHPTPANPSPIYSAVHRCHK